MKIALIAAVARNGVIGHDNALLWHLPEDLQFFKRTTLGQPVIMGRRTWDSIPARFRPLPGRANIVLTRQPDWRAEGAVVARTLEEALEIALESVSAHPHGTRAFVIGGAQLYALALPHADELILTEIDHDFEGDARFPDWPRAKFVEVARERHRPRTAEDLGYSFVTYRRTVAA